MPLVKFELRNEFALGKPELYNDVVDGGGEPKAVLDAVAVSGLVGILRQLGDLSEFAAEVFHGLQEQVVTTGYRSRKLMVRVEHLEAKLPPIEKAVLAQTSHIHFAYTAGCEWRARIRNEHNHFISDDLPRFIMDSYEECRHPPNLHLLDKFDAGGPGSCLKRYTDPSYHKRMLRSLDGSSSEISQQDRKSRKIKKKRSSRKNREISRAKSLHNHSGRMQFSTPINDQTCPPRTSVHDKTLKNDPQRCSYFFDSRSESGHNESVFRLSSSLQPEDQEYRESFSSRSIHQHDELDSISSYQETGMGDDYISHVILPEPSAPSSSSVTWEEKTEIVETLQYNTDEVPDILCTESEIHTQEKVDTDLPKADETDIVQDDVHKLNSSEIQCANSELQILKKFTDAQNVDQIDIPNDDLHNLTSVLEKSQNDEFESDPDDFMDALNTIESESENELDCQVSRYSPGFNDKVTEESTQEHVLHSPDDQRSSMEPSVESHVLADTVAFENVEHKQDYHPSNMESNCGSHILLDRDSPEHLYTDEDLGYNPEHQPSDSYLTTGSHSFVDKNDHEHAVDSPDQHASNMESRSGSHNLADKDANENLFAEEQVVCSPEYQPSNTESNSGLRSVFHRDAYEHMGNNPRHYPFNEELEIISHASAEKDAHSPEHCPDYVEPDAVSHSCPEHMEDSPTHCLSNTELDERACAERDAHSPEHRRQNVEPAAVSHSCSDRDFVLGVNNLVPSSYSLRYSVPFHELPNLTAAASDPSIPVATGEISSTAPFSYNVPSSVSSSSGSPSSVSSQRYSKEHIPNIGEKSLLMSPGSESHGSSSIPDDIGGSVIHPLYSESKPINLPEPSGHETTGRTCESQETVSDLKSSQAVTFWTNGGLLGLQPSKPPDFAVTNSTNQDALDSNKERSGTSSANHMSRLDGHRSSLATMGENANTLRNHQTSTFNEVCSEDQTNGVNFQKDFHSDRMADSSSILNDSGQSCHISKANSQINGPHETSVRTLGTKASLAPVKKTLPTDTNLEIDGKSSESFGLGQRLLLSGFRRKFPPVHNDTSELLRIVQDSMPEQSSRQLNFMYHATPDRTSREPFTCVSIQKSPNSSPPVEHMKISFRPINTSETSRLKLKIMDGSNCHETGNTFSSFQLVPEHIAPLHDIGSDSDDDTLGQSSPYISDEDDESSHPSDSNSEQWESGENPENKDNELYNSLCRMSSDESTSGSSELGGTVSNRNQVDGGITNHCSGNDMEHAFSSLLLDLPDFSSMRHTVNHTAKDSSDGDALLELRHPRDNAPIPPPLPPAPGRYVFSGTGDNGQPSVSKALGALALEIRGSSIPNQSERNLLEKKANGEASLLGLSIKQDDKYNVQKEADKAANTKGMNEREEFLQQIRTKSFNLRPTVAAKATVTTAGSTNVSVTAILEKASAIRQAVGSDDGEDYDTWSDT